MAVKDIYVIGDSSRMVVHSFLEDLKSAGLSVHTMPANVAYIQEFPKTPIQVVVCFDDDMTEEVMKYLRKAAREFGWSLYLIGKITGLSLNEKNEIEAIPGVHFPYWPVPVEKLLEEIKRNRKHILVVDDDIMMLRSLRSWLGEAFDVHPAPSGAAALEFLQHNTVDLVLLDYEMPNMNGKEVLEHIRSSVSTKSLPVMFLTAKDDRTTVMNVMDLRPKGYILKTSTPDEIKHTVFAFFASQSSVADKDGKTEVY